MYFGPTHKGYDSSVDIPASKKEKKTVAIRLMFQKHFGKPVNKNISLIETTLLCTTQKIGFKTH